MTISRVGRVIREKSVGSGNCADIREDGSSTDAEMNAERKTTAGGGGGGGGEEGGGVVEWREETAVNF